MNNTASAFASAIALSGWPWQLRSLDLSQRTLSSVGSQKFAGADHRE